MHETTHPSDSGPVSAGYVHHFVICAQKDAWINWAWGAEGALPPNTVSGSLVRYYFESRALRIHPPRSFVVDQTIFSLYGGIPGDAERMGRDRGGTTAGASLNSAS